MSLHVLFIGFDGSLLSDVTSNFLSVPIPSNAFVMRVCDNEKSYSNASLTKLFDVTNLQYSTVFSYTTKGDYSAIDVLVSDFQGFTITFNQLSAQFIGNNPMSDIYDFSAYSSGSSIDFSTIVTALNGISTALSALTNLNNLSNLVDLANIVTAIASKDNQSNIVNELRYIFTQSVSTNSYRSVDGKTNLSVFKSSHNSSNFASVENLSRVNLRSALANISNKLSSVNDSYANSQSTEVQNKFLYTLSKTMRALFSSSDSIQNLTISDIIQSSFLKLISDNVYNIEAKLEQNLPFSVLVQNDVVLANPNETYRYIKDFEKIGFN